MKGTEIINTLVNACRTLSGTAAYVVRPLAIGVAGRCGGGAAVQFGPWAVKTVVNYTTPNSVAAFIYKQALNAAFGPHYYAAGQVLFSTAAAFCPGPFEATDIIRNHYQNKDYLNALDTSGFDPKQLKFAEVKLAKVKEGYLKITYKSPPVDESSYCFLNKKDAKGLPPLLPPNGKPEFEMQTFKTDGDGNDETAL
ncbi:hypothetical protein [Endozoicomonas sp. ONNA2]|uniref:hypothetical protein n=1 Tax=Endozoicomonas sp. ONNA2 TaxID=2828741 RepID=UPI0021483DB2|nr:hypothetical protein [Endozoicomonas sp. ONNA2]